MCNQRYTTNAVVCIHKQTMNRCGFIPKLKNSKTLHIMPVSTYCYCPILIHSIT